MSKKEQKRITILTAASECFSRYGFDKTTLEDIGKVAKLNKASLYYYFKNKEEIFTQVILEESQAYIGGLQQKVEKMPTSEGKLIQYLIDRLRYYKKVLNLNQLSVEVLHRIEPVFDALYNSVLEQEIEFVEKLLKEIAVAEKLNLPEDSRQLAELFIEVANGLKHETVRKSGAVFASEIDYRPTEEKMALAARLMLKGLLLAK